MPVSHLSHVPSLHYCQLLCPLLAVNTNGNGNGNGNSNNNNNDDNTNTNTNNNNGPVGLSCARAGPPGLPRAGGGGGGGGLGLFFLLACFSQYIYAGHLVSVPVATGVNLLDWQPSSANCENFYTLDCHMGVNRSNSTRHHSGCSSSGLILDLPSAIRSLTILRFLKQQTSNPGHGTKSARLSSATSLHHQLSVMEFRTRLHDHNVDFARDLCYECIFSPTVRSITNRSQNQGSIRYLGTHDCLSAWGLRP